MRTKSEIIGKTSLPIFLLKCSTDFKFFAEDCLQYTSTGDRIKIKSFQMRWVRKAELHKKIIIESGTGSSKTECMGAMYVLWKMLREKNLRILLISKTMEQSSSNLLSRIKRYIDDNGLLKELFTPEDYRDSWNATEIKTANGCWVKNVPYNMNIRGYRAHLIIADEIDSYEDTNIFFEHVISRLFPNGQLIGISTPVGPERIIRQLKEKNKAGILSGWSFIKTPYLVDDYGKPAVINTRDDIWKYQSIWEEQWDVKKLYNLYGDEGRANWMRNIMCENLGEIDDAIFPMKNILDRFDYNRGFSMDCNSEAMYFIGADFAISEGPRADFDAYVVVEKFNEMYVIKWIETHKGWQRPQKVNRLQELFNQFNSPMGTYLIVDESNMGTMVMNDLRSRGIPVIGQSFHSAARTKLITTLGSVFAGKGIVIPRNPDMEDDSVKYSEELKEQLTGFRRKGLDSKTGNRDTIESRATHDDIVMALAMAINEAVQHQDMDCLPLSE
jgi:hypothetical protein